MKKIFVIILVLALTAAVLAGCAGTDVVLKYAPGSFQKIIDKYPNLITDKTADENYYYLTVDGETKLKISNDYAKTGTEDIVIATPLKPFTDAGLDVTKLTNGYRADADTFYLTVDDGDGTGTKKTVKDSLFESVKAGRANLTYHQTLDHYGIKLAQGKFEWAKDYTTNDKDVVFVLLAQPLKDLGVDVNNITGWIFMTLKDPDGTSTDVLVKPADLDAKQ